MPACVCVFMKILRPNKKKLINIRINELCKGLDIPAGNGLQLLQKIRGGQEQND